MHHRRSMLLPLPPSRPPGTPQEFYGFDVHALEADPRTAPTFQKRRADIFALPFVTAQAAQHDVHGYEHEHDVHNEDHVQPIDVMQLTESMSVQLHTQTQTQTQTGQATNADVQVQVQALVAGARRYVARIPFPIFFLLGAMLGVLFAMAVVLTFRNTSTNTPTQTSTTIPGTHEPSTAHAKLLFVWRPEATTTRAPTSSQLIQADPTTTPSTFPPAVTAAPVAAAPAAARAVAAPVAAAPVAAAPALPAARHAYRVASRRAPLQTGNLLSAGL